MGVAQLDVTDIDSINAAIELIITAEGRIDLLVCNAGICWLHNPLLRSLVQGCNRQLPGFAGMAAPGWLTEMDYKNVERIFNVNLHGVFRVAQVCFLHSAKVIHFNLFEERRTSADLRAHVTACCSSHDGKAVWEDCRHVQRERQHRITLQWAILRKAHAGTRCLLLPTCQTTPGAQFLGMQGTKAAVSIMAEGLRAEVAPFGVKVVTIVPGWVRSDILANSTDDWERRVSDWVRAGQSLQCYSLNKKFQCWTQPQPALCSLNELILLLKHEC